MRKLFGWVTGQIILGIINLSYGLGEWFDEKDECLLCHQPVKFGYPYCKSCISRYQERRHK